MSPAREGPNGSSERAAPAARGGRIGVYLCRCGGNVSDTVDLAALGRDAERLAGVDVVREDDFLCAAAGQRLIRKDVADRGLDRVVVAACSPFMHEGTFRAACGAAGLNPHSLQVANIREQVAWVTRDRDRATGKARAILRGAVRRVGRQGPLEVREVPVEQSVLVVGGGIAGIEAALRVAEAGKKVILVEREASLGGHVAMLDRTFPSLDCSACALVPKMARVAEHPGISLLVLSEVVEVSGAVGRFKVRVRTRPRYVDASTCSGCGTCAERCPVTDVPAEIDQGMGTRRAIYIPFPQAVPRLPVIDAAHCERILGRSCAVCEGACPAGSIDFGQLPVEREFEVGGIVLATGFRMFDPTPATQYGYGRWDDIVTSLEFERLCHPSGPTGGEIVRRDGRVPGSIAILHCVGSRDVRFNPHCSRICCMTSLKLALMARQKTGARVFSFYVDLRAAGKNCEDFYERAQRAGVVFVHGKGTEVIRREGKLFVKAEDSALGRRVLVPVDLVVLAVGLEAQDDARAVARSFGLGCSSRGFFMEKHLKFSPVETTTPGVVVAGACQGPKDIPESVAQGAAAAASMLALLDHGVVETLPNVAAVDAARCSGCLLCVRDCPVHALRPRRLDDRTTVEVDDLLCRGCGACAATCPSGAATQLGFTDDQLSAEIEGLLADRNERPLESSVPDPLYGTVIGA